MLFWVVAVSPLHSDPFAFQQWLWQHWVPYLKWGAISSGVGRWHRAHKVAAILAVYQCLLSEGRSMPSVGQTSFRLLLGGFQRCPVLVLFQLHTY